MKYFFCPETMGLYPGALTGAAVGKSCIELTAAQYRAFAGQELALDANGQPQLASSVPKVPTIEELCGRIDHAADFARRAVAGDPLRAVEYDRSRQEAEAFKAAGYQGEVPRMVAAWAINGRTARQAADSILAEAAAYTEALYLIRETRLQAKELIRAAINAGDVEQAKDIAAETIAAIEAAVAGIGNNP